jgi:hypothetical protein
VQDSEVTLHVVGVQESSVVQLDTKQTLRALHVQHSVDHVNEQLRHSYSFNQIASILFAMAQNVLLRVVEHNVSLDLLQKRRRLHTLFLFFNDVKDVGRIFSGKQKLFCNLKFVILRTSLHHFALLVGVVLLLLDYSLIRNIHFLVSLVDLYSDVAHIHF